MNAAISIKVLTDASRVIELHRLVQSAFADLSIDPPSGVLKETLAKGDKRNIAIFYGAGHLKGMDKILTEEMGFHQVGPPFWRVAWDMTVTASPTTKPTSKPAPAESGV